MSDSSWEAAMAQLLTPQRDFMNGDATSLHGFILITTT